jgi:ComF family protein
MSNLESAFLNGCSRAAQALLPPFCVLCGARGAGSRLCRPCRDDLPAMPDARCACCALPLASGRVCAECLGRTPSYDGIAAAFPYEFPIDALVQAYKYGGDLTLAPLFARELARSVTRDVDALVAMPLTASRLAERGFNQAHELARHLGRALDVPVLARACRKVGETTPQAGLTLAERVRNVRRAFVCDIDFRGKRVAIVDDVMTTGATLNELARVVKRAGAVSVSGWVVARTLR